MTKEERHLWYDFLKTYPVQFNRQKAIGRFIVDFYCHTAKLVVELDGSQHFDDSDRQHDTLRTEYPK
jgi:very-short-patch-repair endonuclease